MAMQSQYFVSGSILRHIFSMSHTSMLALVAMVLVDALDLFFLSLLRDVEIIAGLGFAWPIIFFTLAVSLGISTAMTALVSRAEGLGDRDRAKVYATHVLVFGLVLSGVMTVVLWLSAPWMLDMFGATGKARDIGITYVQIVILCLPVLVLSMSSGALLRAIGAKQRAMWSKMAGAAVNSVLDPIFIFGFDWGVEGAAWATVVSRIVIMAVAFYGVRNVHHMLGLFDANLFHKDIRDIARVTVPVGLAKVGPPIASAFIMSSMAKYGPDAVAAMAIIERIAPFVFVGYMALPQAIGPIIGQNFAAAKAERVRSIWHNVWALVVVYGVIVCAALFLFQSQIAELFSATDQTTAYLSIFCSFTAPFYMFLGLQFSSHTFFNVTGRPNLAMIFDLAKELLGVIPLVWLGSYYLGATGVLFGQAAGIVLFGTITGIVSYRLARRMGGI
ncbi:MAG: MATE family efflux transporter [Thalassospira xiamenensis]|uniref:MATE family efflux transporter n=3 Tax=Thalassospira TaxID=168934 RepID=UPI0008DC7A6E|nr:MATE family efflux transporter [Thalassospira xiamenensis]MAB33098.1 MATE family efflux transporter [Thalassospira sp.]MDM7976354.1 MATE family efflux transporter [Thalassospira xiamenensis]OHY97667.1 MATE family efflux transporter [Thalassospira sp. MIT1004]HBS22978.1 MATE family efflux transporter [Thalassospira sp.]